MNQTMSKRLKRHASTLKFLSSCDTPTAKAIIKSSKGDFINCISDVCHNILKGNLKISPTEKSKLQRHRSIIRKIADRKTTQKHKRLLIQRGGFLGALLSPLLKLFVGPLAQSILGQK